MKRLSDGKGWEGGNTGGENRRRTANQLIRLVIGKGNERVTVMGQVRIARLIVRGEKDCTLAEISVHPLVHSNRELLVLLMELGQLM